MHRYFLVHGVKLCFMKLIRIIFHVDQKISRRLHQTSSQSSPCRYKNQDSLFCTAPGDTGLLFRSSLHEAYQTTVS